MNIKSKAEKTLFFSFIIIVLLGTLFHFTFEFSGGNTLVGAFTPVNESIWEHLKLILIPSVIIGALEYLAFGRCIPGYFGAKAFATVIGMLFMLVGYYTYIGIVGENYFVADILLFIGGAALTAFLTFIFTMKLRLGERESIIGILIITALIILFMYFTFEPPMLELFRDPLSEDFGISNTGP